MDHIIIIIMKKGANNIYDLAFGDVCVGYWLTSQNYEIIIFSLRGLRQSIFFFLTAHGQLGVPFLGTLTIFGRNIEIIEFRRNLVL